MRDEVWQLIRQAIEELREFGVITSTLAARLRGRGLNVPELERVFANAGFLN